MKKLFAGLAIGVVVCFGSAIAEEPSTSVATPNAEAPPLPVSSRIVSQAQPTSVSTVTPVKRFAPKGVFFVLQRISAMTDSGVVSAMPGTKVTLVRDGSLMRVTDGQHEYDAFPSQLTNDMDIGEKLAQVECSVKAKIKQEILQKTQEYQKAQQEQKSKVEEMSHARAANQSKAAHLRQQIKDARQAIFENKPDGMIASPLFDWRERNAQRKFIEDKQKEIRDLQNELDKLEANGTVK